MISPITGGIGSRLTQLIKDLLTTQRYRASPGAGDRGWVPPDYLTESVDTVVLQKSIPAQIRQLILYITTVQNELRIWAGIDFFKTTL